MPCHGLVVDIKDEVIRRDLMLSFEIEFSPLRNDVPQGCGGKEQDCGGDKEGGEIASPQGDDDDANEYDGDSERP